MPKLLTNALYAGLLALVGCSAGEPTGVGTPASPWAGGDEGSTESDGEGMSGWDSSDPSGPTDPSGPAGSGGSAGSGGALPEPACCETSAAPGCTDPATEACVCDLRITCCNDAWDLECTGLAIIACGLVCGDASDGGTGGDGYEGGAADDVSEDDGTNDDVGSTGDPPAPDPMPDPMPDPSDDGSMMGPSCGELAQQGGWQDALCEWNGNGACGGQGTPTWDCDFCCEVSW